MKPRGTFTKSEIENVRNRTPISSVIGRFVTWDRKKTSVSKGDYWGCCPFHGEKKPSFHCEDRKGRYHCFGCGASGDVFKFLEQKTGCSFWEAVEQLGGRAEMREETPAEKARRAREEEKARQDAARRKTNSEEFIRGIARGIWKETVPIADTLGDFYFIGRGIDFSRNFPSLRFHPSLEYRTNDGEILGKFPAVVAGLQAPDDGRFLGIWRIYLDDKGEKNKTVPVAKLGLGAYAEYGGSVRLGEPNGRANTCEGIETGLGIVGITGGGAVYPALNTSGLENFIPPKGTTSLLIWPDGDVDRIREVNGKDRHVESPGMKAAKVLLSRQEERGFPTGIQPTPKNGRDYLDVWNAMKGKAR